MLNSKIVKENWAIIKAKLEYRFPELVDTDLQFDDQNPEKLIETLEKKTGRNHEQIMVELNELLLNT